MFVRDRLFVARRYGALQGLRLLPLAAMLAGLALARLLTWSEDVAVTAPVALLPLIFWWDRRLQHYYARTFGAVRQTVDESNRDMGVAFTQIAALFAVLFVSLVVGAPYGLVWVAMASVAAAFAAAEWRRYGGITFREAGFVVLLLLNAVLAPLVENSDWIFFALWGVITAVTAFLDHRLLMRLLPEAPAEDEGLVCDATV